MPTDKVAVTITTPGVYKTDQGGARVRKDGQPVFHKVDDEVSLPPAEARALIESGNAVPKNKTEAKAAGVDVTK